MILLYSVRTWLAPLKNEPGFQPFLFICLFVLFTICIVAGGTVTFI